MKTNTQPAVDIRNKIPFADGTLYSTFEDGLYYVGFKDLYIWLPDFKLPGHGKRVCLTANDEDKFIVSSDDRATCWSEFWNRWSTFCKRAYKIEYIHIERRN